MLVNFHDNIIYNDENNIEVTSIPDKTIGSHYPNIIKLINNFFEIDFDSKSKILNSPIKDSLYIDDDDYDYDEFDDDDDDYDEFDDDDDDYDEFDDDDDDYDEFDMHFFIKKNEYQLNVTSTHMEITKITNKLSKIDKNNITDEQLLILLEEITIEEKTIEDFFEKYENYESIYKFNLDYSLEELLQLFMYKDIITSDDLYFKIFIYIDSITSIDKKDILLNYNNLLKYEICNIKNENNIIIDKDTKYEYFDFTKYQNQLFGKTKYISKKIDDFNNINLLNLKYLSLILSNKFTKNDLDLPNLEVLKLNLEYNQNENLDNCFDNLTNLLELELKLKVPLNNSLDGLTKLKKLTLNNYKLDLGTSLEKLSSLEDLSISNYQYKIYDCIKSLKSLKILNLEFYDFEISDDFYTLEIENLTFVYNKKPLDLTKFEKLSKLKTLTFDNIDSNSIDNLKSTSLEILKLIYRTNTSIEHELIFINNPCLLQIFFNDKTYNIIYKKKINI